MSIIASTAHMGILNGGKVKSKYNFTFQIYFTIVIMTFERFPSIVRLRYLLLCSLKVSRESNVKIESTLFMTSLISTRQVDILFDIMSFFCPYIKRKLTTDVPWSLPAQKTMSHKSLPSIIKEDVQHFLITYKEDVPHFLITYTQQYSTPLSGSSECFVLMSL